MSDNRKNIFFGTRRGKVFRGTLHIEAPGCVVNINTGLQDMLGRDVTAISIGADEYHGEPAWRIPTFGAGEATHINVRVVRDLEVGRVGEQPAPDFTDLARKITDFTERYPHGYVHTTFASGAFDAGVMEYSYSSASEPTGFIYFVGVQDALDRLRVAYENGKG